jgi:hypothetical protein
MVYEDDDDEVSRRMTLRFGIFKKVIYSVIILDVLAMLWYLTRR